MKNNFPCSGCGACCRKINVAVENSKNLDIGADLSFPHKWDEKGVCEMLENNKCKVYDTRPLLCRIDDIRKILNVDQQEFNRITAQACNVLMDEFGIDPSFKINIPNKDLSQPS